MNRAKLPQPGPACDRDALIAVLQTELGHVDCGALVGFDRGDGGEIPAKLLQAFPCLRLYLIDPGPESLHAASDCPPFASERCTLIHATSVEAGEQFRCGVIHGRPLCFAVLNDACTYEDARESLRAWWHNLANGGDGAILAGRYPGAGLRSGSAHEVRRAARDVRRAVEEFADRAGSTVQEIGPWWWLRKEGDDLS